MLTQILEDRQKIKQYDYDNPRIWEHFKNISRNLKDRGVRRYSAKAIFEVIRYNYLMEGHKGFKVNNNYTAYYARKLVTVYPEFKGFFEFRPSMMDIVFDIKKGRKIYVDKD